jgi:hypothetical protein
MPRSLVGAGVVGRAERWRAGNKPLIDRLKGEQRTALEQASFGRNPFVLDRRDGPSQCATLVDTLRLIEETARALLGGYHWPDGDEWPNGEGNPKWPASGFAAQHGFGDWRQVGPSWQPEPGKSRLLYDGGADQVCRTTDDEGDSIEGQPDFRGELLFIIEAIAEARAALDDRRTAAAALCALAVGTAYSGLAVKLFHGAPIAGDAAAAKVRPAGHDELRRTWSQKNAERDAYVEELDNRLVHVMDATDRATMIKKGWPIDGGRVKGLDEWVKAHNAGMKAEDPNLDPKHEVRTLSLDRIARRLPSRR